MLLLFSRFQEAGSPTDKYVTNFFASFVGENRDFKIGVYGKPQTAVARLALPSAVYDFRKLRYAAIIT